MSDVFCTGPALIYVGVGASKAPVFFGTTEDSPKQLINREWVPLRNALAGPSMPADMTFQGETAIIRGDFTKWTESVFAAMQTPPGSAVRGHMPFGSLGTFMKSEGFSYPLIIRYPYRGVRPAMARMPTWQSRWASACRTMSAVPLPPSKATTRSGFHSSMRAFLIGPAALPCLSQSALQT